MEMAEETRLKVGDILICHSAVIMEGSDGSDIRVTAGKSYEIIKILDKMNGLKCRLCIKNDLGGEHHFYIDRPENNYNKWFYNLRELRRNKLKKIKKGLI
jgi:hypothetical protein